MKAAKVLFVFATGTAAFLYLNLFIYILPPAFE